MFQLCSLVPFLVVILALFHTPLNAKNTSDKKISKIYGGYELYARYTLSHPEKKPLKVKLMILRDTRMARYYNSPIFPTEFSLDVQFSLQRESHNFRVLSQTGIQKKLARIAETTPDEWLEPLQDFLSKAFNRYEECDAQFMPQFISSYVRMKSLPSAYTVLPKSGADFVSYFQFKEYSPKKAKIYRTFTGSVIISNTISPTGQKITTAKLTEGLLGNTKPVKPLLIITQVDGVIKKIPKGKIKSSSFWYPHIVAHMKKTMQFGSIFLQQHENMLQQQ